jgi:hypothetical protein
MWYLFIHLSLINTILFVKMIFLGHEIEIYDIY